MANEDEWRPLLLLGPQRCDHVHCVLNETLRGLGKRKEGRARRKTGCHEGEKGYHKKVTSAKTNELKLPAIHENGKKNTIESEK